VVFVLRRQKRNGTDSFHFGSVDEGALSVKITWVIPPGRR
jgi:hypothetical protein